MRRQAAKVESVKDLQKELMTEASQNKATKKKRMFKACKVNHVLTEVMEVTMEANQLLVKQLQEGLKQKELAVQQLQKDKDPAVLNTMFPRCWVC